MLKVFLPLLFVTSFVDWLFSLFSKDSVFILENVLVYNTGLTIMLSALLLIMALYRSDKSKPTALKEDDREYPTWLLMFYSMFFVLICYLALIFSKAGMLYIFGVRNFGEDFFSSIYIQSGFILVGTFTLYLKKIKSKK